jgi:hypothetical protein
MFERAFPSADHPSDEDLSPGTPELRERKTKLKQPLF